MSLRGPLDGVYAKIQRANEGIKNLDVEISEFLASLTAPDRLKPYEVIRQLESDGREYVFRVRGNISVPLRFAVLTGEILHNLRSSLDHLIVALIIANNKTPNGNNQFPICPSHKAWMNAKKDGRINGLSASAISILDGKQPYHNKAPLTHALWALNEMGNQDKHSLLHVVASAAKLGENVTVGSNDDSAASAVLGPIEIDGFYAKRCAITEEGAEVFRIALAKPEPTFEANAEIALQIVFERCVGKDLLPVMDVLVMMHASTARVVQAFAKEF